MQATILPSQHLRQDKQSDDVSDHYRHVGPDKGPVIAPVDEGQNDTGAGEEQDGSHQEKHHHAAPGSYDVR